MKSIAALLAIVLVGFSTYATAQADFPSKPIQIILGYAAGGGSDVIARVLSQEATRLLGREVIVVNKPGGSGLLAAVNVAAAQPDGHTLGLTPSVVVTTAHFLQDTPTDLLERTTALTSLGHVMQALVVRSDSPFNTLKDLIEQTRRDTAKVSIGVAGVGTGPVLVLQSIALQEKVEVVVVPFVGEAPALTALLGGHIGAVASSALSWQRYVASGALRIIGSMEENRPASYPNAPTLIEQGFPYTTESIYYLYGPRGLPAAVSKRLIDAFGEAARSPGYVNMATNNALDISKPIYGKELERFLTETRAKVGIMVKMLGSKKN